MENKYLIGIVACSKRYNLPRDKIYASLRAGNSEIPFIKIGNCTKIHVQLLEELLKTKTKNHESLF